MQDKPLFIFAALAVLVVMVILMVGVGGFARGGDFNRKHGNRMMRWRVIAQAAAVALILIFIWLRG
ncbi:MAG TPA: twin transmembrane helix small protein [Paracoccus sp.]|nr:twin transmembrane helix small protein [Paracoccus sp. (in: a-proteobacteria)]